MKLYDAPWAPSPRRVRIFLAEKGLSVARETIDLRRGEQFGDDFLAKVPQGTVPALELDSGEVLTESAAICRYFEAMHPEPPLFGRDPLAIARIESWTRRIEADGYAAAVYTLRNSLPAFADRGMPGAGRAIPQIPELATRGGIIWDGFVAMLDAHLATRDWIAGDAFAFVDITALVTIDFARAAKLAVPDGSVHLRRWYDRAAARPSARA